MFGANGRRNCFKFLPTRMAKNVSFLV